jgi:hypothetical protein
MLLRICVVLFLIVLFELFMQISSKFRMWFKRGFDLMVHRVFLSLCFISKYIMLELNLEHHSCSKMTGGATYRPAQSRNVHPSGHKRQEWR